MALVVLFTSCEKEKIVGIDNITGVDSGNQDSGNAGKFPDTLVSSIDFNGKMLVFRDGQTFAETYKALSAEDISQAGPEGPAALIAFESNFKEFRSLRAAVQQQVNDLLKADSLTEENNPDDLHIADFILRTLVNEDSEVNIGGEIISMARESLAASDPERGGCCWMFREKTNDVFNGNGTKKIRCKSWVYNIPIPLFWFGVTGSSTMSYHMQWTGASYTMLPAGVATISTSSNYTFYEITCSGAGPNPGAYSRQVNNSFFVQKSEPEYTFFAPFFITQRNVNHGADYYTGSDIYTTIDFCL